MNSRNMKRCYEITASFDRDNNNKDDDKVDLFENSFVSINQARNHMMRVEQRYIDNHISKK